MTEGYSRELSSCGFWPGGGREGAFYSYAYPQPDGFADYPVEPDAGYFSEQLGEFVLPYEAVRTADDPDHAVAVSCGPPMRRPPSSPIGTAPHSKTIPTGYACDPGTKARPTPRYAFGVHGDWLSWSFGGGLPQGGVVDVAVLGAAVEGVAVGGVERGAGLDPLDEVGVGQHAGARGDHVGQLRMVRASRASRAVTSVFLSVASVRRLTGRCPGRR
jgi:uncharacterized protein DUF5996